LALLSEMTQKFAPLKENQIISTLKRHYFDAILVENELEMYLNILKETEEDDDWVSCARANKTDEDK
jgi:hypothetical protein